MLLAVRYAHLRAVVLAVWGALSPSIAAGAEARAIAGAIADAVVVDPLPVWDADTEAATLAVYTADESGVRLHPLPWVDPRTGRPVDALAHGPFQIRGPMGLTGLAEQARTLVTMLHAGADACPVSPLAPLLGACGGKARRIANWRFARARRLLEAWQDEQRRGDELAGAP